MAAGDAEPANGANPTRQEFAGLDFDDAFGRRLDDAAEAHLDGVGCATRMSALIASDSNSAVTEHMAPPHENPERQTGADGNNE